MNYKLIEDKNGTIVLKEKRYKIVNEEIELLHKKIEAQDKIINTQALEIARLKEKIDKVKECIKNRNTTKSKKERFMSGETTLEKVLEILGDKENEC